MLIENRMWNEWGLLTLFPNFFLDARNDFLSKFFFERRVSTVQNVSKFEPCFHVLIQVLIDSSLVCKLITFVSITTSLTQL